MITSDLFPLLPVIIIAFTAVLVMFMGSFKKNRTAVFSATLCGYGLSFASTLFFITGRPPVHHITPLIVIDGYGLFYIDLIAAASVAVAILSYDYLKMHEARFAEYYVLLLTATLGAMILAVSAHFASFFLGLETLSLSLYVLVAYLHTRSKHVEAGIKYLVLSAVSTAFLLFGMALVYYRSGTMEFSGISIRMASALAGDLTVFAGTVMLVAGIGFKLSLVPFHMWAPDVYEGAPAPVTAYISTISKGAVFAVFLRYFREIDIPQQTSLFIILSMIAVASMFVGNFLALFQNNVKRLLAYSSIAQFGYLLVAFLSSGTLRVISVFYFLVAYFVMTIGAFGIITLMSDKNDDADSLDAYAGLFFARPWVAIAFALMLLSLAGMPLTMGLVGKLYIFAAGISSDLWFLAIVLVVNSILGLYYYLRVISAMFLRSPAGGVKISLRPSRASHLVIIVMMILLVWLGVYPASLIGVIQKMIGS
jgi:NADH-quinone oxidoreductase subunit N